MNKHDFLNQLRKSLVERHVKNIDDIIADYEEHFSHAKNNNKSEEEICTKLGSPETIALAYETETMINTINDKAQPFDFKKALSALGRLIIIAPFNFFVLMIPGAITFSLVLTGWCLFIALVCVIIAIPFFITKTGLFFISAWLGTSAILTGLGLVALAVCFALFMFYITKTLLLMAINYLQWNLKFILEK